MCLHNARRDNFLLKPIKTSPERGQVFWNPVTGTMQSTQCQADLPTAPLRMRKGRARLLGT